MHLSGCARGIRAASPDASNLNSQEAIMPYAVQSTTEGTGTGGGPRITFLDSNTPDAPYLVVGAYNNVNNVVSGSRPMLVVVNGGLTVQGLGTPPAGANLANLVIDKNTGRVYRAS